MELNLEKLKFDADGLIPAVVVDHDGGRVLMVAYMNRESLRETVQSGHCVYWSRSRQKRWKKGESSGHVQEVRSIRIDCDMDTLVIEAVQHGAACHKGYRSCFYRELSAERQWVVTDEKVFDPDAVYPGKDK